MESQLREDLAYYGIEKTDICFDYSDACIEGHATRLKAGMLHNLSGVAVRDSTGTIVAYGWIDFIHGGGTNPLFVFWDQLTVVDPNGKKRVVKPDPGIPSHLWEVLPIETKMLCANSSGYDSTWASDPLVIAWKNRNK